MNKNKKSQALAPANLDEQDALGHSARMVDITGRRQMEERLSRLNACFLGFGPDPMANINQLTGLCGELLDADCALYNRLYEGMLCSWGQWQTPPDYNPVDNPEGHICYDVIQQPQDAVMIIRNLPATDYAETNPNVKLLSLQTYMGKTVRLEGIAVGSLCVMYQRDFVASDNDLQLMTLISGAIAIEERRRQAEVSLKEAHEYLKATLDALPDLLFEVDRDGRFYDYHTAQVEALYVPPDEFLGKTVVEALPTDAAGIIMATIEQAAADGRCTSPVYALDLPAGRRWYEVSIAVKGDSTGEDGRFIALARDVTKRMRVEEIETRLGRILEESLNEIYIFDAETLQFIQVNQGGRENLGYTMAELEKLTPLDIKPELTPETFAALIKPLQIGEKKKIQFTTVHQRKDRSLYPVEVHLQLLTVEFMPVFVAIILDITERKQAETALQKSKRLFAAVTEQSSEGIGVANTAGNYVLVNAAFCNMTGYTRDELLSMNVRDLVPDETELELFPQLVNGQSGKRILQLQRQDGSRFFADISGAPIETEDEQLVLGVIRDITDQVRAEKALHESNKSLRSALADLKEAQAQMVQQERLAAVGQLAAGIAHDFNNLMAAIILYADLMLTSSALSPKDQERVSLMRRQGRRAALLTQQILDFSRKSVMQREILNLPLFLQELHRLFIRTLPENIQLSWHSQVETCPVSADPTRLQQAIMNLVINARDAMPQGGKLYIELAQIEVTEGGERPYPQLTPGQWAQLSVADSGSGIPEDVLEHIFEPFFTTRAPLGSGLGLSQVFGIIRQHDGYIDVATREGAGAAFTLYLPMLASTQPAALSEQPKTVALGRQETILIVEDDRLVRKSLLEALAALNYRPFSAANGLEALAFCREPENNVNLVITDLIMPEMGGEALLNKLQELAPTMPVIIMTGYLLESRGTELLSAGAAGWLEKPVNLLHLSQELARVLAAKRP